ncbi:MAG: flagellar basal body L-ring protein FlgH [Pseudomonadota bacterium]|nr:flagellar basal body L-ring protein FlgH [Pseudomonadota bacterium]
MTTTKLTKFSLLASTLLLTGCFYSTRPEFTPVEQSVNQKMDTRVHEAPIHKPRQQARASGSLWQHGAKGFFKDSRARDIGDIVTVIIKEEAKAEVEAETESNRTHNGLAGINRLLNMTNVLGRSGIIDDATGNMFDTNSNRTFTGDGKTEREDTFEGRIAAMVTEVMPNGYLVIQGQREVLVNYELQNMTISGIIRPDDIAADNTIPSEKVAEARIAYAGRGMVDEAQETQPAVKFLDKWLPF